MHFTIDETDDPHRSTEALRWRHAGGFRWRIQAEASAPSEEPVPAFRAHVETLQQFRVDGMVRAFGNLASIFNRSGATYEEAIRRCDAAVRYWIEQYGEEVPPG